MTVSDQNVWKVGKFLIEYFQFDRCVEVDIIRK